MDGGELICASFNGSSNIPGDERDHTFVIFKSFDPIVSSGGLTLSPQQIKQNLIG